MILSFLKRGGLIAMVLAAITVACGLFWQSERDAARALADHGQAAIATVVDKETRTTHRRTDHGTRRTTTHHVTYAYEATAVDGGRQSLRVRHDVPRRIYDDVAVGETVEIRYLPEDPTRAEVYPGEMANSAWMFGMLTAMAAAATALALWIALHLHCRERRLDEAGLRTLGTVESVRRTERSNRLTFRFTDAQGQERRGSARTQAHHEPGGTVALRYDPKDPTNVALS